MKHREGWWLACVVALLAFPALARKPPQASFPAIHSDSSLLGRKIRLEACMSLPLSANPTSPNDQVLLYPCGLRTHEAMLKNAIMGKITSERVVKPFNDAGITFEGEVGATFLGTLSKVEAGVDGDDAYFVLAIDKVISPFERDL